MGLFACWDHHQPVVSLCSTCTLHTAATPPLLHNVRTSTFEKPSTTLIFSPSVHILHPSAGKECEEERSVMVSWMPRRPHRGWDKLPTLPFPPPTVSISLCTYIRCGCSHCTGPIKLQLYSSDGSAQCRVELWVGSVENAGQ